MLSIGAMATGQEAYYQNLARENYYLSGGEPPGIWHGGGSGRIGLSGRVSAENLSQVFKGFAPDGSRLVQNAGKNNRQPGWDFTFSAPKSVSVLWSQLDKRRRQQVQLAQQHAVLATVGYFEKNHAFSRVGRGGGDRVPVGLVAAIFEHGCSRALDMQLHTHVLIMNVGIDGEGVARSLLSRPLYQLKMLAGAYYRAELAYQLQQRLGIEVERPETRRGKAAWFEVRGISVEILNRFSKRREAIVKELGERGLESASAASFAALGTRPPKSIVPPRSELYAKWKEEGRELGFKAKRILGRAPSMEPKACETRLRLAIAQAVHELTSQQNYFTANEMTRRALVIAQENRLPAEMVASGVAKALTESPRQFISLGSHNGNVLWTARGVLETEANFRHSVQTLRQRRFAGVPTETVNEVLKQRRGSGSERFRLDPEQQQAVRYLTQGTESVKVLSGFAGTGKTETLAAAREALEKEGYRVLGTALAGVAARALSEKAGIQSCTVRALERRLDAADGVFQHHAKQLWRAAQGRETESYRPFQIDAKTVLIIDEGGMVGVCDWARIFKAVVEQGGSVVAVGDERQLSAIERPGAFEYLVNNLDGVKLTNIRRQKDLADRQAVQQIVHGDPKAALEHYAARGQLCVAPTVSRLEGELLADWSRQGGAERPQDHRIFAATIDEVERLNRLCQWERVAAGAVNASQRVDYHGDLYMVGDRVRFDRHAPSQGIAKGESGTVVAVKSGFTGKYVSIALDRDPSTFGERFFEAAKHHARQLLREAVGQQSEKLSRFDSIVVVPLETLNPLAKTYQGLRLDYAMTTHLAQGQTVPCSYVLLGGAMTSRELTYVQASRHREGLYLYAKEDQAGAALAEKARENRPSHLTSARQSYQIPARSPLIDSMERVETQQLASSLLAAPLTLEQESSHVR